MYLGHIITDKLYDDDDDMLRQRRMLYAQANMLSRKFYWCSTDGKINLFKTYCTPLYTVCLWVYYKASLCKLVVAYNDCLRVVLRKPRWTSASDLFCQSRISSFEALLRNLMYKFICRLNLSQNAIIKMISDPSCSMMRYVSNYWQHWYK